MSRRFVCLSVVLLFSIAGCDQEFRPVWHDVALASGKVVKVTAMNLVWGVEHDSRDESEDSFALEFVSEIPANDEAARERELGEVFDLIRPASETWHFTMATVSRFPTVQRAGHYDFFLYTRAANGTWSYQRSDRKVFAND